MDHHYLSLVEPYYSTNTNHFHTYTHAKLVTLNARKIAEKLWKIDIIKWIVLGASFHDAWYHHPEAKKFPSKEDYSIHLLQWVAKQLNISKENLDIAIEGIEWTKINQTHFNHIARKILRATDINDLWDEYDKVLHNTIKIYHEYQDLNMTELSTKNLYPLPREIYRNKEVEVLDNILDNTKKYIPEHYFLHDNFYQKMEENINRLSQKANPLVA